MEILYGECPVCQQKFTSLYQKALDSQIAFHLRFKHPEAERKAYKEAKASA